MSQPVTDHGLDDDVRIGVPGRGSSAGVPLTTTVVPPVLSVAGEPLLRAGDEELGRPSQIPVEMAQLTEEDRRKLRQAEEDQALRDLAEAEELLASDPAIPWLGWFAHPLAVAFLLGSAGVLGLYLSSRIIELISQIRSIEDPIVQAVAALGASLCGLAVLYSMVRLVVLYVRLRRNQQIRLAGLVELQQRTRLRWLANAKAQEARGLIEQYLKEFPLAVGKEQKRLEGLGFPLTAIAELRKIREELLDPARFTSTPEWFARFRTGFQAHLDEVAEARIRYWSKRTGIVTAVAPNALIDSAASIYFGFAMLTDLCTVYHLRAGRTGTAVLLGRVFFNSYLAGQLNEWEKLTEEQLNHLAAPGGPLYELMAARMFSKIGAKVATGTLNYFLLARLGRYACRLLRPVA